MSQSKVPSIVQVIYFDTSSGAEEYTLPSALKMAGHFFTAKKTNSGGSDVTIRTTGSETIDGSSTYVLTGTPRKSVMICCDGLAWHVVSET